MLRGEIVVMPKPVSVAGCANNFTLATTPTPDVIVEFDRSGTFFLYRVSYLYYTLIGMLVCIMTGSI
ncbi:jg22570, partial [Pararge aegeria aegeria]